MKGNMNHFLQAILNDILKNKEEKIPVEENIPATELSSNRLVKEKNEKRIETEQSQKKNSKEDEEFIAKLNILINENMAGEELSIKFLTDKMAYELNLNTRQYNDAYEINFDFLYAVRNILDDVTRGEEWALDDYYYYLDLRNDDLRWVLNDWQYRSFMSREYFYRPIYADRGGWSFRMNMRNIRLNN
jgi:hypothetical protein